MNIRGREIKFMRTVSATCDIADLCPNGDVSKIGSLLQSKSLSANVKNMAEMIHALNKGYEENRAYYEDGYKANPISVEELMLLSEDDFMSLFSEATVAFYGEKPTIEAEPKKGKKNKAEESA